MNKKLKSLLTLAFVVSISFWLCSCADEEPKPKVVYNNVKIMSVKVLQIPANDPQGGGWDASNGPDIFLKIGAAGSELINTVDNRWNDNTSYPKGWNFVNPLVISNLSVQYDFYIYDYDSPDTDDLMGAMGYVFSNSDDYPATLVLTYQGTQLELELQWF